MKDFEQCNDLNAILFDDKFSVVGIVNALKLGSAIFIVDPNLCDPENREKLLKVLEPYNPEKINWFYFENNIIKAIKNIKHRNDNRVVSTNTVKDYYAKIYTIPFDAEIIEIWQA